MKITTQPVIEHQSASGRDLVYSAAFRAVLQTGADLDWFGAQSKLWGPGGSTTSWGSSCTTSCVK